MALPNGDGGRYDGSRARLERARKSIPNGTTSPFRAKAPVPLYFEDAHGCRLRDVDGNEYIDYTLAWGPLILGHRHPRIVEAVRQQADRPHIYGAQHDLEYLVAEQFCAAAPCAERVAFTCAGTEAVQLAMRLARGFTGRNLILKFEGHYHGWADTALVSHHPTLEQIGGKSTTWPILESLGQVPNAGENLVVRHWNDIEAARDAFSEHAGQISAVIMEAVLCNSGCLTPSPGYLEGIRRLCDQNGALLIFDEVITGFRMSVGGAQGVFGVTPDLATYGKAIAAGLPLSAVAGRADVMDLIGNGVSFGGTFNGNPLSLAASHAALDELSRDEGALLQQANAVGRELMAGIRNLAESHQIPVQVEGFGAAFAIHFTSATQMQNYRQTLQDDGETLQRFLRLALDRGVNILPDGRFYVSTAHSLDDVTETLEALDPVFAQLAKHT